jgi:hypothetical protein
MLGGKIMFEPIGIVRGGGGSQKRKRCSDDRKMPA